MFRVLFLSSSFFVLIIPRHPISTLFPYTTLFRSRKSRLAPTGREIAGLSYLRKRPADRHFLRCCFNATLPRRDRKSTRLNSSHLGISYAVFCLKKKKKNIENPDDANTGINNKYTD